MVLCSFYWLKYLTCILPIVAQEHKEEAKRILGFKQVPFIVVLDQNGDIVQMGSKKQIDFENIPGMSKVKEQPKVEASSGERAFVLDDDF